MMNIRVVLMAVIITGLAFIVSGCTAKQGGVETNTVDEVSLTCIAVLPVVFGQEHDGKLTPLDKKRLAGGVLTLDSLLKDRLYGSADVRFVAQDQSPVASYDGGASFLSMLREVGSQTGCNGVLAVTLHRYRDRSGGSYAADEPASVAFSWRLVEVNSGAVLCHGRYDETQESVMENLLYFKRASKRGFAWVTAERLLADGLDGQFADCSFLENGR